jgi:hypothetical protein
MNNFMYMFIVRMYSGDETQNNLHRVVSVLNCVPISSVAEIITALLHAQSTPWSLRHGRRTQFHSELQGEHISTLLLPWRPQACPHNQPVICDVNLATCRSRESIVFSIPGLHGDHDVTVCDLCPGPVEGGVPLAFSFQCATWTSTEQTADVRRKIAALRFTFRSVFTFLSIKLKLT